MNFVPPSQFSPNSILFVKLRGLVIHFIFPGITPWGMNHISICKNVPMRQGCSMLGQTLMDIFWFSPFHSLWRVNFSFPHSFDFLVFTKKQPLPVLSITEADQISSKEYLDAGICRREFYWGGKTPAQTSL